MSAENISYELKRFAGIKRDYTPDEVERLRGSIKIEYSLCKQQSVKLWKLLNTENYISTLGSLSGNQAVQHAKAGGAAALAGAMIIGPRLGRFTKSGAPAPLKPFAASSIPLVTIGVFILWLGWFGFNGGSQLALGTATDAIAVSKIFINTFLAGAGGVMGAAVITRLHFGKTDVVQMLNGCIGGLVAVTAEPLLPSPFAAILIGAVGGLIVVYGTKLLFSLKIDDVVGAIPAHLFAGIWGTLIVPATNSGANFSTQLIGVLSVNIFVFIVAYIVFSAIKATIGLRLSKEGETKGTDVTETGVIAYAIRD